MKMGILEGEGEGKGEEEGEEKEVEIEDKSRIQIMKNRFQRIFEGICLFLR